MYTKETTADFIRAQFKELLSDGQAHGLKEIVAYANQKALECHRQGIVNHSSVWAAIRTLTTDPGSGYSNVRHGVYQESCYAQPELRADQFDWDGILDRAAELQALLAAGFGRETPMPHMTPEETQTYAVLAKNSAESMERVIEDVAVWLAQIEDHTLVLRQEETPSMTMTM